MGIKGGPTSWSVRKSSLSMGLVLISSGISIYGHKMESYSLISEDNILVSDDIRDLHIYEHEQESYMMSEQWSDRTAQTAEWCQHHDHNDITMTDKACDGQANGHTRANRQDLEVFSLNSELQVLLTTMKRGMAWLVCVLEETCGGQHILLQNQQGWQWQGLQIG